MSTLHNTINALASEFAHRLLAALRSASLDELIAETSGMHTKVKRMRSASFVATSRQSPRPARRSGKRIRRSVAELEQLADRIVAIVAKHPDGIRAEDLKRMFGVPPGNVGAKVFTRPLAVALASKKIRKSGARRATTYFTG